MSTPNVVSLHPPRAGVSGPEILHSHAAESDEEIVRRVLDGEIRLFEVLMRRHNTRLYRVAYSILGNEAEAEDVMQESYVRAFDHLDRFEHRARFATWLTKIAVHAAGARLRRRRRVVQLAGPDAGGDIALRGRSDMFPSPEQRFHAGELREMLRAAIDALPDKYRAVFVLREVEGLDTAQTAECLDVRPGTVKIRLHRARRMMRKAIERRLGPELETLLDFHLSRCDGMVERVFARIDPGHGQRGSCGNGIDSRT